MLAPPDNPLASLLDKLEAWLSQGLDGQAADLEARLIARAGGDPRLWAGLADMRLRLGRSRGAVQAARRAFDLAPTEPAHRRRLAQALVLNGRWAEATDTATAAVAGGAGASSGALAGVLLEAGRPDLAERLARQAVIDAPGDADVHRLLAACARQTGDVAAAREHVAIALRLNPDDAEAVWLRSDLGGGSDGEASLVDDLRRRARERPSPLVLYALGRELERLGDAAAAFAAVAEGAASMRETFRYDVEHDVALLDARTRRHAAAALGPGGRRASAAKPIFVLGLPRTGTSLIERVLSAHSQVRSLGEPPAFDRAILDLAAAGGATNPETARLDALRLDPARLGSAYLDILGRPQGVFIDKRPLNVLHVAAILAALPQARIVLVERDSADAGWAIFKTPFAGGAYPYSYDLAETGRYLAAMRRLQDHWRSAFGDDILSLRYEDLVADFEPQARRLLAFCGLPWEDGCLDFHRSAEAATSASAMQVRRPLYSSSVGLWRRYEAELRPLTDALQA